MSSPKGTQTLWIFLSPQFSASGVTIKPAEQQCLFTWATSEVVLLGLNHAAVYYSWGYFSFFDVKAICAYAMTEEDILEKACINRSVLVLCAAYTYRPTEMQQQEATALGTNVILNQAIDHLTFSFSPEAQEWPMFRTVKTNLGSRLDVRTLPFTALPRAGADQAALEQRLPMALGSTGKTWRLFRNHPRFKQECCICKGYSWMQTCITF